MISSHHNPKGFATLGVTLIILFIITGVTIYLTSSGVLWQRVSVNSYKEEQAFHAAEAGLEFGIMYLKSANILVDADHNGFIDAYSDSNTTAVALTDGALYSVVFSNPVANNFRRILITSLGVNNDGTATRTVSQEVYFNPTLTSLPTTPLAAIGEIELGGDVTITNTETDKTIVSGGDVEINGSAATFISSGMGSDRNGLGSDVTENDSTLGGLSGDAFFQKLFGSDKATIKNSANYVYQNSSNTNYSATLSGKTDALIWIEQTSGTATINANVTIGSPTNPVILVVEGELKIAGSVKFYGVIYVIPRDGTWNNQGAGTAHITGAALAEGKLKTLTGTIDIIYSSSVFHILTQRVGAYAKVAGSWNDL